MAEAVLFCNIESCKSLLDDSAVILPCSHRFCPQHGDLTVKKEKCLLCSASFSSAFSFITNVSDQAPDAPLPTAAFYQKPFCADCQAKDAIISNSRKIIEDLRNEISRITAELAMFKSHLMKSNRLVKNLQFELGLLRGQNQPNPNINDPNVNPGTVYFRHVGNNSNHKMRPFVPCTVNPDNAPNGDAGKGRGCQQ